MEDRSAVGEALQYLLSGSPFAMQEPALDISGEAGDPFLILARTIEREVIPRLLLKHRVEKSKQSDALPVTSAPSIALAEAEVFSRMLMEREMSALSSHVVEKIRSGKALDALLLDLFAPSARRLSTMWDNDGRPG